MACGKLFSDEAKGHVCKTSTAFSRLMSLLPWSPGDDDSDGLVGAGFSSLIVLQHGSIEFLQEAEWVEKLCYTGCATNHTISHKHRSRLSPFRVPAGRRASLRARGRRAVKSGLRRQRVGLHDRGDVDRRPRTAFQQPPFSGRRCAFAFVCIFSQAFELVRLRVCVFLSQAFKLLGVPV